MDLEDMWEELRSYPMWRATVKADPGWELFLMLQRGSLGDRRHFLKSDPATLKRNG